MKWIDIDPQKEFRIFVYDNEITDISQQHIYSVNDWLSSIRSDLEIKEIIKKIMKFLGNI